MSRNLSANEAKLVLELEWREQDIVTLDEIQHILGCKDGYARFVAHTLVNKRWLERLGGGRYLFIPASRGHQAVPSFNPLLIGKAFVQPYYFSYSISNSYYGFSSQLPARIYIACLKTKRKIKLRRNEFCFVHLKEDKFFGYVAVKVLNDRVQMADKEKSVVDSLDKPLYAGGIEHVAAVLHNAQRDVNWEKLINYALRMGSTSLIQRLGFLVEALKVPVPDNLLERLQKQIGGSKTYLGSIKRWGKRGAYNDTWQVVCNVPRDKLLSQITIG